MLTDYAAQDTDPIITAPGHTQDVFNVEKFPEIVKWTRKILKKIDADAIVTCGHSGLLLAGAISATSKIPVFAVRKASEQSVASADRVSAYAHHGPAKRWVWLDDLVGSGGTMRRSIMECWLRRLLILPYPHAILCYTSSKDLWGKLGFSWSKRDTDFIAPGYRGHSPNRIPFFGRLP
jgi:hypothetical protein